MQLITFSLVFVAFVAASQAASTAAPTSVKDKITAVSKKCAVDTKVTADQAKIVFSPELPKTESERCFLECVYKGAGIVKDNKFDAEGSRKLAAARFPAPEQKVLADKLIDACTKEVKADSSKCGLGKAVRECFYKHGKEVNFFPASA